MNAKKPAFDKEKIYNSLPILLNIWIVISVVNFILYLVAPLLGGSLSYNALLHYGSLTLLGVMSKLVIKYNKNSILKFFMYLCFLLNFYVWFTFPYNFVLSIVISILFFYKTKIIRH